MMFRLEEVRPNSSTPLIGLIANFTNRFDAYYHLDKVFWCGCKFIAFTTHNIFTDFNSIFPTTVCIASPTTSARTAGRRSSEEQAQ